MIHNITNSENPSNFRRCLCKKPQGYIPIRRFLLGTLLHTQREMEQVLLAYSLPRKTIAAIMMLYKNMKVKVHSPGVDTDFYNIVAGVLQGDTLAPYLFIICQDYILWMSIDLMKENDITLEKARSRWYPAQTITDTNNTDDIVLLANTPSQAKSLLHSLEQAASCINLYVNAKKMEHTCFNQSGNISTLNGGSLRLVDQFTYLRSSGSSMENDINTWLAKTWTAIDRLSVIWKSDQTDEIKCYFFQTVVMSILLYGCTTWMLYREKPWQ